MKAETYDKQFVLSRMAIDQINGCWNWQRSRNTAGYAQINQRSGFHTVHRLVYFLWFCYPGDLYVCHHCDNKICVNPDHLFLGTNQDNQLDAVSKGIVAGPINPNPPRGEACVTAKLTESDVRAIRSLNENKRALAARFGISLSQIKRVQYRKSWSHVP